MSELGTRTVTAAVLLGVALLALWLGGWAFAALCAVVVVAVCSEWTMLVRRFNLPAVRRLLWLASGAVYVTAAGAGLVLLRDMVGFWAALVVLASVWATDIGAYFAGRSIGGPKIAPRISPSKTWAGLLGGAVAASVLMGATAGWRWVWLGIPVAILAQGGDFFESAMKRRAGVKDSGRLLPGHGGVFDRVDGLLPVAFVTGAYLFALRGGL